jgi:hypothetical protein
MAVVPKVTAQRLVLVVAVPKAADPRSVLPVAVLKVTGRRLVPVVVVLKVAESPKMMMARVVVRMVAPANEVPAQEVRNLALGTVLRPNILDA